MKTIIASFYEAFTKLDASAMTTLYHNEVTFHDPAFGTLTGERAKAMWHMLCNSQKGKAFEVSFSDVNENQDSGSARWEAIYVFSKTGRKVHNTIKATFKFKDGLIIAHHDSFNLHRWAIQALGLKGRLLGRTSFFKNKLQKQTNAMLDKYIQ